MAVHFFVVAYLSLVPNIENILRKREIFKSKLQMFGRLLTYICKVTWSITFHFNTPFKCQISIFIWIDWTGIASIACGISKALHCSFGKTFEISYIKYFLYSCCYYLMFIYKHTVKKFLCAVRYLLLLVFGKCLLNKMYNCSGPPAFKSQRVGYQSNQKLLQHYQH